MTEEPFHTIQLTEDGWGYSVGCPYPKDSTECGLLEENPNHDGDTCCDEDGCTQWGWRPAPGCAVQEFRLGLSDMGVETSQFSHDRPTAVRVKWQKNPGFDPEDAYFALTVVES